MNETATGSLTVPQAMYVNGNKENVLKPAEKTLLSLLCPGKQYTHLIWPGIEVIREQDSLSAICQMHQADEMIT